MFFSIGRPKGLSDLGVTLPELPELRRQVDIALVDDEPFARFQSLQTHGFRITELGGDIRSVDQIASFPVVVCDIKGVGKAFGSRFDGAHVVGEIRKAYPDKWLIAYTGMSGVVPFSVEREGR